MPTRKEYVIDLLIKVKTTSADWKKVGQKKGEAVLPIFVDFRMACGFLYDLGTYNIQ